MPVCVERTPDIKTKEYDFRGEVGSATCIGHGFVEAGGLCWRPAWCSTVYAGVMRKQIDEAVLASMTSPHLSHLSPPVRAAICRVLHSTLPAPLFMHFLRIQHSTMRFVMNGLDEAHELADALLTASSMVFGTKEIFKTIARFLYYRADGPGPDCPSTVNIQVLILVHGQNSVVGGYLNFVDTPFTRHISELNGMRGSTFAVADTGEVEFVAFMFCPKRCRRCNLFFFARNFCMYDVYSNFFINHRKALGFPTPECVCSRNNDALSRLNRL
jgi:hypothetical protein